MLFGFDPAAADRLMPMTTSIVDDGGTAWLEVQVAVASAMDDLMTWQIEFSADLETWTESPTPP